MANIEISREQLEFVTGWDCDAMDSIFFPEHQAFATSLVFVFPTFELQRKHLEA